MHVRRKVQPAEENGKFYLDTVLQVILPAGDGALQKSNKRAEN